MALTMLTVSIRLEPWSGRSLTSFKVGASPPPCPPPTPPAHPRTSNTAATPSNAGIPIRRALFTLPPCLDRSAIHPSPFRYGPKTVGGSPLNALHERALLRCNYGYMLVRCQAGDGPREGHAPCHNRFPQGHAGVAALVDAPDSKSGGARVPCRFEPDLRYCEFAEETQHRHPQVFYRSIPIDTLSDPLSKGGP